VVFIFFNIFCNFFNTKILRIINSHLPTYTSPCQVALKVLMHCLHLPLTLATVFALAQLFIPSLSLSPQLTRNILMKEFKSIFCKFPHIDFYLADNCMVFRYLLITLHECSSDISKHVFSILIRRV